ncbi:chordin-like protein 2 [Alexandromys fortis]|uniref:chordin-like protein 2 n=1 Tax=Alexandromys fortis TaxID=100897 RepID=UPI0021523303|nr:chordin-like protein 2 [Microtus fortis]
MVPGVRIFSSLLGLVMLWFPLDSQARARPGKVCLFGEKIYTPGQSWHPYLEPQGTIYCVRCTCTESGHVNCYRLRCPPLRCSQPVVEPQQCCPRCVADLPCSGTTRPFPPSSTSGVTSRLFVPRERGSPGPQGCSTEFISSLVCSVCQEGHTYCGLMTCPDPGCPTPLPLPDSCCQTRKDRTSESSTEEDLAQLQPGERQDPHLEEGKRRVPSTPAPTSLSFPLGFIPRYFRPMGTGSTTVKIILKEKHKKACTHNGKTYSHGEVWHPTVLSFGPMPCILCTCVDGEQDCHRVTCPTQYPCSQPKKMAGKCCKICPDEADADHSEVISTKCPKVPGQVSVYTLVSPSPDGLHRFVLEHEASDQVETYIWKLVKGIFHLVQIKRVRKQDFQKEAQNFRLLTGTHEGYWTIFLAQTPELKVTASPDKATKTL